MPRLFAQLRYLANGTISAHRANLQIPFFCQPLQAGFHGVQILGCLDCCEVERGCAVSIEGREHCASIAIQHRQLLRVGGLRVAYQTLNLRDATALTLGRRCLRMAVFTLRSCS